MKTFPVGLDTLLATGVFVHCDLYDFTLPQDGSHLRYTTGDVDVLYAGNTYTSKGPYFDNISSGGSRGHWKAGPDVDTWEVTVAPSVVDPITGTTYPAKIFNQPWMVAVRVGVLAGAPVSVHRLYMSAWPSPWVSPLDAAFNPTPFPSSPANPNVLNGLNNLPIDQANGHASMGAYPPQLGITGYVLTDLFAGRVGQIVPGRVSAKITLQSWIELLQRQIPRNVFSAGCRWTLFDAGCQLVRASFAVNGAVTARTNDGVFNTNLTNPDAWFTVGMITFTSGNNAPLSFPIRQYLNASGNITLMTPCPYLVQVGDAFTTYPGCDFTQATCTNKFANTANFGGFPFIPTPETAQ